MNDLVSVVVPVFNYNKYLKYCLNSIINQSYKNLEIIIVDDGSDNKTSLFLDDFKNDHSNVFVYHNANHGVSYSRNFGINHSNGEYILFQDSDDWLEIDAISSLLKAIDSYDVSCGILREVWPHNDVVLSVKEGIFTKGNTNGFIDVLFNMHETSCAKLYRVELLLSNNIYFDEEIKNGEDAKFIHDVFSVCDSVVCVNKVVDNYNKLEKNTSVSNFYPDFYKWRFKELKSRFKAYEKWSNDCKKYKSERAKLYYSDIFSYYLDNGGNLDILKEVKKYLDPYVLDDSYNICGINKDLAFKLLDNDQKKLVHIYRNQKESKVLRFFLETLKNILRPIKRRRFIA